MRSGRLAHRLAACLAILSLLGWLALPSEHIHVTSDDDHAVERVHRHLEVHVALPHDEAVVDHEDEATYLAGPAAALTRVVVPAPHFVILPWPATVTADQPLPGWRTAPLVTRVHAPPWRDTHPRRGPPTFAV